MTVALLPSPRIALRHPSLRAAIVLLVLGPPWVAWLGTAADAPIRFRVLTCAIAVVAAFVWDDRIHALTASTPTGLPAVRRGRALVVGLLLVVTYVLGWLAVPPGMHVPVAALVLQTGALVVVLAAVVGWIGRDGEPILALPVPVVLITLGVLFKLPAPLTFLRADPGTPGWPAERARWFILLAVVAVIVLWLQRDPASRWPRKRSVPSRV